MDIVKIENIVENKIIDLRGQKVIVDSDVAKLYGLETKRINEAVRNNPDKFPDGYLIELTTDEWEPLKTKFSTSIKGGKVKLPVAFSERGLYMLATILKSSKATETTLAIIDTFTKVREIRRGLMDVVKTPENESEQKTLLEKAGNLIGKLILPNDDDMEIVETESKHEFGIYVGYKYTRINRKRKKQQ